MSRDRERWEARYEAEDFVHGVEASEFLRENCHLLPRSGLALDVAAGEGRNAAFLAGIGLSVIALDISLRALKKCRRLANVSAAVVDLTQFSLPRDRFDLVINFYYLNRDLAPEITSSLRRGGLLVFETLTVAHLRWKPDFNPEFLLRSGELLELFSGLRVIKYREIDLQTDRGPRSVASLIARKETP